jgi:hypothetical protein
MGEKVKNDVNGNVSNVADDGSDIDEANAVLVLPILKQFLGV